VYRDVYRDLAAAEECRMNLNFEIKKSIPAGHAAECKICAHGQREAIEREFINWRSPAAIAKSYKPTNRASVYRHAHAYELYCYPNGLEGGR
jgi:hypothetical protein